MTADYALPPSSFQCECPVDFTSVCIGVLTSTCPHLNLSSPSGRPNRTEQRCCVSALSAWHKRKTDEAACEAQLELIGQDHAFKRVTGELQAKCSQQALLKKESVAYCKFPLWPALLLSEQENLGHMSCCQWDRAIEVLSLSPTPP